jgi:hypothetical protein
MIRSILRQNAMAPNGLPYPRRQAYGYKYFYNLRMRKLIYVDQEHTTANAVM